MTMRAHVVNEISVIAERYAALDYYQALVHIWKIIETANQYIERSRLGK